MTFLVKTKDLQLLKVVCQWTLVILSNFLRKLIQGQRDKIDMKRPFSNRITRQKKH